MSISKEIQNLDELRQSGLLSDAEFEQAKQAVLASSGDATSPLLSAQLDDLKTQQAIAALDREWAMEREELKVTSGYHRYVPNRTISLLQILFSLFIGVLWFVFVAEEAGSNPYSLVIGLLPAFGFSIGLFKYLKAQQYDRAEAAYQRRRRMLELEIL